MAAACAAIAVADRSWVWLIGGGVFLSVALFARGQLAKEQESGPAPPRLGFVGMAMLVMVAAILVIALI
jgi:hypothetical protein